MSRIIVLADSAHPQLEGCPVLMNEQIHPEHLQDGHLTDQLIERIAWAICDASADDLNSHDHHALLRSSRDAAHRGSLATPTGRTAA
jgi:hypothetical protein